MRCTLAPVTGSRLARWSACAVIAAAGIGTGVGCHPITAVIFAAAASGVGVAAHDGREDDQRPPGREQPSRRGPDPCERPR
jgi:hypothetical protein